MPAPSSTLNLKSQFEGAAVFGTSLALFSEITATNGAIDQSNFNNYQVARMNQAPRQTNVYIVESDAPPQVWANRAFRRSRRRCATRSSQRPANACASCRSQRQI